MRSTAVLAVLLPTFAGWAHAASPQDRPSPGQRYEISVSYETQGSSSDGSHASSSRGRDVYLERVVAVRDAGVELEYDLPEDADANARRRSWYFPARIWKPTAGPAVLLNVDELELRLTRWLEAAKWTRAMCGRLIFTWNAFRIECEPRSVAKLVAQFDLRSTEPREGATYRDPQSRVPGTWVRTGPNTLTATLEVDPEIVRRARAAADVDVGELTGQPVALDAALARRSAERISGILTVRMEMGVSGEAVRRVRTTKLETRMPDGRIENDLDIRTVERRALARP